MPSCLLGLRRHVNVTQYKRLTGNVKTWTRKGDSGKDVTNNYCANCNALMVVDIESMPGVRIYKMGTYV